MLSTLLDIVANPDGNYYFENKAEALIYALIGFLVVVVGILIIIAIIWLVGFILQKTNNFAFLGKLKRKPKAEKVVFENRIDEPETAPETVEGDIPDEVKAAIVAAIMAYYEQEQPKCEFTVKRIKRM